MKRTSARFINNVGFYEGGDRKFSFFFYVINERLPKRFLRLTKRTKSRQRHIFNFILIESANNKSIAGLHFLHQTSITVELLLFRLNIKCG